MNANHFFVVINETSHWSADFILIMTEVWHFGCMLRFDYRFCLKVITFSLRWIFPLFVALEMYRQFIGKCFHTSICGSFRVKANAGRKARPPSFRNTPFGILTSRRSPSDRTISYFRNVGLVVIFEDKKCYIYRKTVITAEYISIFILRRAVLMMSYLYLTKYH